jgi:hypothetical protein
MTIRSAREAHSPGRRRLLALLGGLWVLALVRPSPGGTGGSGVRVSPGPRERPIRVADLYRPHDLAG